MSRLPCPSVCVDGTSLVLNHTSQPAEVGVCSRENHGACWRARGSCMVVEEAQTILRKQVEVGSRNLAAVAADVAEALYEVRQGISANLERSTPRTRSSAMTKRKLGFCVVTIAPSWRAASRSVDAILNATDISPSAEINGFSGLVRSVFGGWSRYESVRRGKQFTPQDCSSALAALAALAAAFGICSDRGTAVLKAYLELVG